MHKKGKILTFRKRKMSPDITYSERDIISKKPDPEKKKLQRFRMPNFNPKN